MAGLPLPRILTALILLAVAACNGPGGWRAEPGPPIDVYRRYAAAPHEVRIGLTSTQVLDSRIEAAGERRSRLQSGAMVGIVRWSDPDDPARVVQLNARAGFDGEFDQLDSDDNLGWDGAFGLQLDWRLSPQLAWKLGLAHLSSHLGDEYIEETGATRKHITREEVHLGVSRDFREHWRAYGEFGWAIHLGNYDLLDRPRLQAGLEWEGPRLWWQERLGFYGATDLSSYEEDDWEPNLTLQGGFSLESAFGLGRARLGLELYDGRIRMGEHQFDRETSVGLGIWF